MIKFTTCLKQIKTIHKQAKEQSMHALKPSQRSIEETKTSPKKTEIIQLKTSPKPNDGSKHHSVYLALHKKTKRSLAMTKWEILELEKRSQHANASKCSSSNGHLRLAPLPGKKPITLLGTIKDFVFYSSPVVAAVLGLMAFCYDSPVQTVLSFQACTGGTGFFDCPQGYPVKLALNHHI